MSDIDNKVRRCQRCVLPESYPGLELDGEGICSFCRKVEQEPRPWKDELRNRADELNGILDEIRADGDGAQYDCVVPFSGGKDSSYALYLAQRKFGLRALAVNFQNGLQTNSARSNIDGLCSELGVPLVTLRPQWPMMRRMYARFLQEAGEFCSVCNAMGYLVLFSFVWREAAKTGRTIYALGGWSSRYDAEPGVYSFDVAYFSDVLGPELLEQVLACPLVEPGCLELLRQMMDPRKAAGRTATAPGPVRYIMLPDYMPWYGPDIEDKLAVNTPFVVPPEDEGSVHFDCEGHAIGEYLERRKYGFAQKTISYAAYVRDGLMDRQEALGLIEAEAGGEPDRLDEFLARLGITRQQVRWDGLWHAQR